MRNLEEVIERMLSNIPDQRGNYELKNTLCSLRDSLKCSAPEVLPHWWIQAQEIMINLLFIHYFDDIVSGSAPAWVYKVKRIWKGEE